MQTAVAASRGSAAVGLPCRHRHPAEPTVSRCGLRGRDGGCRGRGFPALKASLPMLCYGVSVAVPGFPLHVLAMPSLLHPHVPSLCWPWRWAPHSCWHGGAAPRHHLGTLITGAANASLSQSHPSEETAWHQAAVATWRAAGGDGGGGAAAPCPKTKGIGMEGERGMSTRHGSWGRDVGQGQPGGPRSQAASLCAGAARPVCLSIPGFSAR